MALDRISAVVCATGSNHDGVKKGLTLPNGDAQAQLIRQTLKKAGLVPADIHYFEVSSSVSPKKSPFFEQSQAHGTGTKVGDPIEAKAIGSVFAPGRKRPLNVGSIKSNLGHLEGASGLMGVIKTTLCLENAKVLPNMHFNHVNPAIDLESLKLQVPTALVDWPSDTGPRRAAVNSFGYGGSNAHVILESYRPRGRARGTQSHSARSMLAKCRPYLVPLTSHTEKATKILISRFGNYLQQYPDVQAHDFARSLSIRRTMHRHRSFAIGHDSMTICNDILDHNDNSKWIKASEDKPRLGFVFTGQGAQWYAMGRQLIELSPIFRATLERCDKVLQRLPDSPTWSCLGELLLPEGSSRLAQSKISQPVCAALQMAIVDLLANWGIEPAAVIGHSSGEIAAAYAAGALSFDNAIICAYYRGLYMSKGVDSDGSPRGAMIAVGMSVAEGVVELEAYAGRIALAAVNSPSSLTMSGDMDAILELKQAFEKRRIFVRQLRVEQAFHSHHMVPLSFGFERALMNCTGFRAGEAKCQMHSSVTARDSAARKMDASYWSANMTGVVRFSEALTGIMLDESDEKNVDILVEIGAHPVLHGPSTEVLKTLNLQVPYIASLTRKIPAFESLLATAGQLFARGYPVDLVSVNGSFSLNASNDVHRATAEDLLRDLPTYPWDHNKFWADTRLTSDHRFRPSFHSILGAPVPGAPAGRPRWRNYLRLNEIPWLSQHIVDGKVIFPGAGYVSMAIEAIATQHIDFQSIHIKDVVFKSPLSISDNQLGTEITLELEPLASSAKTTSSTWSRFTFYSFNENGKTTEHSHGLISVNPGGPSPIQILPPQEGLKESQSLADHHKSSHALYQRLHKIGLQYGDDFQLVHDDVTSYNGHATALLKFQPDRVVDTMAASCVLHPTLLDASFHVVFAAIENLFGRTTNEIFVPSFVRSMTLSGLLNQRKHDVGTQEFWVKTQTSLPGPRVAINNISLQSSKSNDVLIDMSGFEMTALGESSNSDGTMRRLFFELKWQPAFDQFSGLAYMAPFEGLSAIMDAFAHQFPNSRILHLTDDLALTREVLSYMGGSSGRNRRIHSLTPYSRTLDLKRLVNALQIEKPRLVCLDTPIENEFDLVIASRPMTDNVLPYLKDGGYVLSEANDFNSPDFKHIFASQTHNAWQKAVPPPSMVNDVTILISESHSELTASIASELEAKLGGSVQISIASEIDKVTDFQNIISLLSLDDALFLDLKAADSQQFYSLRSLLTSAHKNIVWVTSGGTLECTNPEQAIMTGLLRAVRSENEDTRAISLDLPAKYDVHDSCRKILTLLNRAVAGDEFALRDGLLHVPRVEIDEKRNEKLPNSGNRQPRLEPFRQDRKLALKIGKVGLLDTLAFEDDEEVSDSLELGEEDVEVRVEASALNFRDIAASMGLIEDYRLGDECAGVVLRTGHKVKQSDIKVGDRVLATRPGQGAHRSIVRNPAILCQKIGDMDFATATALGGVFVTAYYSLVYTARLQAGEYCLIHSAAGGVGQMAIQIAQRLGAKVIATVGSKEKREYLKKRFGLEDDTIFSSRDASFAKGVMKVTANRGCDVALNSLAGELLHETWRCIAPFGRLIEIGKRDIHENTKLDMDPFRKNISYASVDLITLHNYNKPLLAQFVRILFEWVTEAKIVPPQPLTTIAYGDAHKAFRLLQMGKHFGKIVLMPGENDLIPVLPPSYQKTSLFHPNKTYLLVGGLGGIGRSLAEWMLRRGARHLAFLSRSGADKRDAEVTLTWLKAKGIGVSVFRGDVADKDTVVRAVQQIGPRLAGVFQAAMVLRDTPYHQMSLEQWRECANPKVHGTWNLHTATAHCQLDFFVCFSSGAALLGSLGQANYSAANSYIDALMSHRRSQGLPGSTMNVGVVTGVGAVAEDAALEKTLERFGYEAITEEELFYQIEEAITTSTPSTSETVTSYESHRTITGINLQRKDLYWASKPIFQNLYANLDLDDSGDKSKGSQSLLVTMFKARTLEERAELLMAAFLDKVASVLSMPVTSIKPENSLSNYGLDSIVAVEFRKWFFKTVKIDVAVFDIVGSKSITSLVEKVNSAIVLSATEGPANTSTEVTPKVQVRETGKDSPTSQAALEDFQTPYDRPGRIPLSTFQNRLWNIHHILKDPSTLNLVITCFLRGELHFPTLQRALIELGRRNETLRTAYVGSPGSSEQKVLESLNAMMEFRDISTAEWPQAAVHDYIERSSRASLNIENGEVMKATQLKLSEGHHAVVLVIHHIALDNGSTVSTLSQVIALYDALRADTDLSLVAAPKHSYIDFTLWGQHRLRNGLLTADLEWWAAHLHGAPAVSSLLPFAQNQRPAQRSSDRLVVSNTLSAPLLRRMKRVAATDTATATPFHFLLAALRGFLHRYTKEDDVTLLLVDGTRPHPAFDDVLGYFVNLIPLRCTSTCNGTFDALLAQTTTSVLEAIAHSIPFEEIVNVIPGADPQKNASHFPLGQIVVNYQTKSPAPRFEGREFRVEEVRVRDMPGACELAVEAMENPQGELELRLEFDSFLYARRQMEVFWGNFGRFLGMLVRDYRQPLVEVRV